MTPIELIARYPDRGRPLITHYDGPGARVELSVASTLNAVAKAGSMLRDGLGLAPGAEVSIDLPRHWQLPVWVSAALSAGARVGRGLDGEVEVRVIGPRGLPAIADGQDPAAQEVLVSSCDAFGMPIPGGVPPGVIDIALEVRGYPDTFAAEPGAGAAAALLVGGSRLPWADLVAGTAMAPGTRLWIDSRTSEGDLLRLMVEPLVVAGSLVIGTDVDDRAAAEIRAVESAVAPS